ncbi:aspartate aminotransferase family protein [Halomonas korlensis]|uniref:Adenosylmethionine-8-amino-7-oxononanoate aminotransferase n=1 Tax=Halomonas korlensis TaxID=463301 RepID=A0A1I7J9U5_9GAMM|nr:aminotransferase class III-fold pyridoxal phosphate-dependent enzyme [Halomonas korlensis]SFU81881.1 Adenosylmethionine-8-amino-7-oxononanoate aminotransferase [Halomonas korlensis]
MTSLTGAAHSGLIQNKIGAKLPVVERAEGVWLYDSEGKDYIDGCSGAVVANLGHSHPHIVDVIRKQSAKVTFVHRGAFASSSMYRLADRLSNATGMAGVWLVNSGSEAVEAAIQFALQYFVELGRPRPRFLSHRRSYHGNTLGALSLSGHARRAVLGELALDFNVLPDPYSGAPVDELLAQVRAELERTPGQVAGIVFEPLSGATLGCVPLPDGYLQGLRALADEFGTLLIADEVMTGLGRTGRMLACDHWGVRPDIAALGKGLGAGYTPIAAALVSGRVLDAIASGSGSIRGGHTYGGNPLSVAVADAVLELTLNLGLADTALVKGEWLSDALRQLAEKHPMIVDVRGCGLMWGVDLARPGGESAAAAPIGERLRQAALAHGLVIYPTTGGFNDACIIAPPLTITEDELQHLVDRLDAALTEVESA